MNQLLIALLISTSLTGVIQSGFVSSLNHKEVQVIDQHSSIEENKAKKDELGDLNHISLPLTETSSKIVQNRAVDENVSCVTVDPVLIEGQKNKQSTSTIYKKVNQKDISKQKEQKEKDVSEDDSSSNDRKDTSTAKEKAKDKVIESSSDKGNNKASSTKKDERTSSEKNKVSESITTNEEDAKVNKGGTQADSNVETKNEAYDTLEQPNKEEETITVTATAYTANCEGGTGVTYTGVDLRANPESKVIAVDPTVIPLGTKVYVEGYGYATAADIGGAIKGNKIDVFIPSQSEAEDWGMKTVEVKILN